MSPNNPPPLATWLLEHITPGPRNDAITGDLLEEFRSGRSARWYWCQILAVIAIAFSRQMLANSVVLLYTVLWSTLVPAWLLSIAGIENHFNLTQRFWQMDWPWSILCDWGLLLAANLFFIWTGIALYLVVHLWTARNLAPRPLARGIASSFPILVAIWAVLIVLPKMFLQIQDFQQPALSTDPARRLHIAALIVRLPFFFAVLCSLWGASSRIFQRASRIPG